MAWTRGSTIGRGSTATVSLAATTTGDLMAVKSTTLSSSGPLKREEQIMSQLDSPYIVKCLGSDTTYEQNKGHTHDLFLEFIPGQTLHDLTASRGGSLDEESIRFFSNQILRGLNYLHDKGVAHCDIKGHNILVGSNGIVKITDFGCAVVKRASPDSSNHCNRHTMSVIYGGTPAYMSPEVARGKDQGFAADIWALGCTVIEMATGHSPWRDSKDPVSALYRIGYSDDVPETPTWFSDSAKDFVGMCLIRDPNERWSAKELLSHCFFDSLDVKCNGIDEFTRKISPTSVMDRGVWDDMKGSSSCSVQDSMDLDLGFDCFDDRIMGLVRGCHGVFLDWEEDGDDWVNVRGVFEVEDDVADPENLHVEDDHDELNEAAAALFFSLDGDEVCAREDLLFDSFNDVIISVGDGNNVLRDEFVSRMLVILERILIEFSFFFLPNRFLLRAF